VGETTLGLARLADAERDALAAYAARASWPSGFAIYQRSAPADGVFVVTRGRVVLRSRVRAGRGFVPWIATPGETFGSEGLSPNAHYSTDARADEVENRRCRRIDVTVDSSHLDPDIARRAGRARAAHSELDGDRFAVGVAARQGREVGWAVGDVHALE